MAALAIIVGCGRSGTTWLAGQIGRAPQVTLSVEQRPLFDYVMRTVYGRPDCFEQVVEEYRDLLFRCPTAWHVDKCHPALWLAERLAAALPKLCFLAVVRGPHGTVASTLRHKASRVRLDRWREDGFPNRFLGIETAGDYETWQGLTPTERATWKWCAHAAEVLRLGLRPVDYEAAVAEPERTAAELSRILGIDLPPFEADYRPVEKWRRTLEHPGEVDRILELRGFPELVRS